MASKFHIGFSSPIKFNLPSRLIKWWQGKDYSHVYIRFESESIISSVYHAAHGTVHFLSYDNFLKKNKVVVEYELEVPRELRIKMINRCMSLSNVKYDYLNLIKILIHDICERWGADSPKTHDGPGYVCSELVAEFLSEDLGIKIDKPRHLIKPSDIEEGLMGYFHRREKL
jgi:hypothetical protein